MLARTSHHLFQPLLYQVATGILSEGEVAPPVREVLRRQQNARVLLGDVTDVDLDRRTVCSRLLGRETMVCYDTLVVAAGATQSYFGNDQYARHAPGLKTIDDALEIRGRIFGAFELAELAACRGDDVGHLLTFAVVGAGPTGVELAGQIAELAGRTLRREFRSIRDHRVRVLLIDAGTEVLQPFGARLGARTRRALERLGVEVLLDGGRHRRRCPRPRGALGRRAVDVRRGPDEDLGRRGERQPAGPDPRGAVRGLPRQGGAGGGEAGPHAARARRRCSSSATWPTSVACRVWPRSPARAGATPRRRSAADCVTDRRDGPSPIATRARWPRSAATGRSLGSVASS